MKIALVCPHMFMNEEIMDTIIFAPGTLAITLANGLNSAGHEVTLFSPGTIQSKLNPKVKNINSNLKYINEELNLRGYGLETLLNKHPLLFATLSRHAQSELVAKAYRMANKGDFDIVHIYMNEEEIALEFADFCTKPVVFTHHEPFNYLARYRDSFQKHADKNWISISYSQRNSLKQGNFIANIYNGIELDRFNFHEINNEMPYFAYFGRIIEPKGVHLAILAAKRLGIKLKIAGKHYSDGGSDKYWEDKILPFIKENESNVEYVGFLDTDDKKEGFLGGATALLIPSTWDEPFGMVMIEALACGTPVIGLNSGSIVEIIKDSENGFLAMKMFKKNNSFEIDEEQTVGNLCDAINKINLIKRIDCRKIFEENFTVEVMCKKHIDAYKTLIK